MKTTLLVVIGAVLFADVSAQTVRKDIAKNQYYNCINAPMINGLKNNYCSDGLCYSGKPTTSATFTCNDQYNLDGILSISGSTTYKGNGTLVITELDRRTLSVPALTLANGTTVLKKGESLSVQFQNQGEKAAFIDIDYSDGYTKNSKNGQQIGFYVFNPKITPVKIFNMTASEKVLLPQSEAVFTAILVAEGGDYAFKIDYSTSVLRMAMSVGFALLAFAGVMLL